VDKQPDTRMVKLAGTLAAVAASAVAQKVISAGWRAARGHKPPVDEDADAGIGLGEVLAAAALTGAVVAVVRVLATRGGTKAARQIAARQIAARSATT
jgi:hypothetical protein